MGDLPTPPPVGALEHWRRLLATRWKAGAAVFLAVLGLAASLVLLSRPVYRAEARLRIGEPPPMSGVSPAAGILSFFRSGGDPFANDLELLKSRTVAEGVVEDAALNLVIDAPRGWHRDSLFSRLEATRSTPKARYRLDPTPEGTVTVRMTSPDDWLIGTVRPGEAMAFGSVTLVLNDCVVGGERCAGAPRTFSIRTLPFGEAVRQTRGRLSAQRTRREANVLDLSYDHPDPGQALAELRRAEQALKRWQERTRLIAPDEQSKVLVERYSDLSAQIAAVKTELGALDPLLARVEGDTAAAPAWADLVAFPRFVQNQTIGALVAQLTELERDRLALASRRTPENRDLRVLDQQVQKLQASLESLVRGYREATINELAGFRSELRQLDSMLGSAPSSTLELARRQRDVRLLSEVYLLTQQRLRQEELREALTFSNVQVIDPPALRYKPVWPRKKLGLGVGFLVAGVFGLLAMAVQERADRSVRGLRDIGVALDAPVLLLVAADESAGIATTTEQASLFWRQTREGGTPRLVPTGEAEAPLAELLAKSLSAAGVATVALKRAADTVEGAAAAAASGGPVALVVNVGRTRHPELARAATLLRAAGARVTGVVAIVPATLNGRATWL
ncbi:MAG: hypothetical protein HYW06_03155 [Gemmatimonadetes bacterium]|nr:hypothetical protein [Gemmatimonadota bacterium]